MADPGCAACGKPILPTADKTTMQDVPGRFNKAATTQLYFPDEVTNAVYARAPYDRHPNRDTTNATDRFLGQIADKSLVMWTMTRDGDGYLAAATLALRAS
jgi:hypothetical protein